jgi:hypothetical protein
MARSRKRSRRRHSFGMATTEHAARGEDWLRSARGILRTAVSTADPCRAITHYTDAIAELTVAEVQFHEGDSVHGLDTVKPLWKKAHQDQRKAIAACRRK